MPFANRFKQPVKAPTIATRYSAPAPRVSAPVVQQPRALASNPVFRQPAPMPAPTPPAPMPTSFFHPEQQLNMFTGTNTPPGPVTTPGVPNTNQTVGGYATSNPPNTAGTPQTQLPPDVSMGFGMPPPTGDMMARIQSVTPVQGQTDPNTGMTTQGPGSPQYIAPPSNQPAPGLPPGVSIGFGPALPGSMGDQVAQQQGGMNALPGFGGAQLVGGSFGMPIFGPTGPMQAGPGPQQFDQYGNPMPQ